MTRARALKQAIRARAEKTGERYTTARRHVLRERQTAAITIVPVTPPAVTVPPAAAPRVAKGSVSDAKAREKTGHGLDHWFAVLDRFGAVEKGHTAAARHLWQDHKLAGWYAQGITVAYERERGVRTVNQRCDGEYEVSASKMIDAATPAVIKAFTSAATRKRWLADVHPPLAAALTRALADKTSKGIVVRPDGQGRFRYKWGTTVVQMYFYPKGDRKTSVVATNSKLPDAASVDDRRAHLRAALAALAAVVRG